MKHLIFGLLVLIGSAAQASNPPQLSGNLDTFYFQPDTYLAKLGVTTAYVQVDPTDSIELVLLSPPNCLQDVPCAEMMQQVTYKVKVDQPSTRGGCQETIYKGTEDKRPVDGNKLEITVTDNRENFCEFVPPMTEVELLIEGDSRMQDRHFSENHRLTGPTLSVLK